jgi:hypothetical protein
MPSRSDTNDGVENKTETCLALHKIGSNHSPESKCRYESDHVMDIQFHLIVSLE